MLALQIDRISLEQEACRRSLSCFVREAWHVLEPGQPYIHGWHVDVVCEHLEAVTRGDFNRLLVNIPPGTMKSMLIGVFWPAWEWGPKAMPHMRFIGASHEQKLAIRDTVKMRRLVTSDWYQERWGVHLMGDQNEKTFYENASTGFRQACAVASMTGRRGDRVTWDDPHSVEGAKSEADRATALDVFRETLPTRLNNPISSAIVVVMQRLHESDVSGLILEEDFGYEHLMLPMEFEPERRCVTSLGVADKRTYDGELLFPDRFPLEVVERDKKLLGTYGHAGQNQQRPAPRKGGFFEWEKLEIVEAAPPLISVTRYWDKAGTEGGGAYTAGVKMGRSKDGLWYVLDVVRGQWGATTREKTIKQTAETDSTRCDIWIEQEPGSGGKESAEGTIMRLAGYNIRSERATGDKAVRAEPYAVQVEAENIKLVKGHWNKLFIDEHKTFPNGKYKDQIDAASGCFNKIAKKSTFWMG
ncbi:phage terminase large subunit [Pseudomonas arsenicoxydans]|uniref:Terminase n=1 Tax=Pseudomonas arsenicoxydans TaxID=702115 RepID=A0A502HRN8_9PSED|nr:phage terminase large subunit [Pseudomonas arsenicoxydans]TPG76324.1 terminase [Pseudomonas arsenicoxydans]